MKAPFAYVLHVVIARDFTSRVSVYSTLPEAELALRAYAESRYVWICDEEIIETLAGDETYVHIYAVTKRGNKQTSAELQPFARAKKAA